jgi:hypothetical protein
MNKSAWQSERSHECLHCERWTVCMYCGLNMAAVGHIGPWESAFAFWPDKVKLLKQTHKQYSSGLIHPLHENGYKEQWQICSLSSMVVNLRHVVKFFPSSNAVES